MRKMKVTKETEIKLALNVKPVKLSEVTPWERQLWRCFWSRLIASVQDEIKDAQKESPSSQAPVEDALTDGGEGINP